MECGDEVRVAVSRVNLQNLITNEIIGLELGFIEEKGMITLFGKRSLTLIEKLFPPRLSRLHPKDDLPDTLGYKYRLSRRGIEANPRMTYGCRVATIHEGHPAPKLKRGHA